jgi:hypothetical protein
MFTDLPRRRRALGAHNGPVVPRSRIVELVHGAVRAPEDADVDGASPQELEELEQRLGHPLPGQLADWLRICRGAAIGPGGFFGNRPDRPSLDIPAYLDLFPEWAGKSWLPVAGDGCGNYYVLLPSSDVGFVDTISSSPPPTQTCTAVSRPYCGVTRWETGDGDHVDRPVLSHTSRPCPPRRDGRFLTPCRGPLRHTHLPR